MSKSQLCFKSQSALNKLLVNSRGVTYRAAVHLYCYMKSTYRGKKNINKLRVTRSKLAKAMFCSKESISRYLAILERFGLIQRIIEDTISKEGQKERNTMFIEFLNVKVDLNND